MKTHTVKCDVLIDGFVVYVGNLLAKNGTCYKLAKFYCDGKGNVHYMVVPKKVMHIGRAFFEKEFGKKQTIKIHKICKKESMGLLRKLKRGRSGRSRNSLRREANDRTNGI